jgi:hypothetical protein
MIETELNARFAALADSTNDPSWAEVVARARAARRHRRRVPIAIAVFLASSVVITSPATGVGGKIVRLFDRAGPPPQRIVESFGGRVDVQANRAIKVIDARKAGVVPGPRHMDWSLWLAPTKDGGFCMDAQNCYGPHARHDDRLGLVVCLCGRVAQDGEILAPPVILEGGTSNERATSLLLRFEDGERQPIPLVWVGVPVNEAFFLYGVPKRHWQKGHLPTTLTMLSADGDELDTREVHGITTRGSFPAPGPG